MLNIIAWPGKAVPPFAFSYRKAKIKSERDLERLIMAKGPPELRRQDLATYYRLSTFRRKHFLQDEGCADILGVGGEGFALWRDCQHEVAAEEEVCCRITVRAK